MPHHATTSVRGDAVSVLIATKNRPQDVLTCIRSVNNQSVKPDEIVIVDVSDKDGLEASVIKNNRAEIRIRYVRSETGLTHQRNIGVRESTGDIVLVLEDDVVLDEDYVREVLKVFNNPCFDRIRCVFGEHIWPKEDDTRAGLNGGLVWSMRSAPGCSVNRLLNSRLFLAIFFYREWGQKRANFDFHDFARILQILMFPSVRLRMLQEGLPHIIGKFSKSSPMMKT
ncbi:MAG: glycosyltransferase family 2 protein [Halobacteriota archaeon]